MKVLRWLQTACLSYKWLSLIRFQKVLKGRFQSSKKKNHKKFGKEAAKVKDRFNRETVIQTREEWKKMSVRAEIEKLEKQSNNWKTMPFRILPCLCYLFRKSIQTRGNGMILREEVKNGKRRSGYVLVAWVHNEPIL